MRRRTEPEQRCGKGGQNRDKSVPAGLRHLARGACAPENSANGGTAMSGKLALVGLILACGTSRRRREYPDRPVKIVVPVAAGGGVDVMARLLALKLGRAARPAVRGGEPAGRRRRDRQQGGDRLAGRRHDIALHAVEPVAVGRGQQDAALRSRQGFHADHQRRDQPLCAGGAIPSVPAQGPEGIHCLRQGQSRQAQPTARPASAAPRILRANCSRARSGSTWCTCRTRA